MNSFDKHFAKYKEKGIEYLQDNLPEIQRIKSLDSLKNLTLKNTVSLADIVLLLHYEATAPTLFPAVRQRLVDAGVAKRHNMLHTIIKNEGTPNELYNVTMGFYGSRLQISLDVHR